MSGDLSKIVIKGENNITNLLLNSENSVIGSKKSENNEINNDPLKKLDKKYLYFIKQPIKEKLLGLLDATIRMTDSFYLQYINNELFLDHLHRDSYPILRLDSNGKKIFELNYDELLTLNFIPFNVKFPMANYSHSLRPLNNYNLLTDEEKELLNNSAFLINDEKLIQFCNNIQNGNDSRFKVSNQIGNYEDAFYYFPVFNPLANTIVVGKSYNQCDLGFMSYDNDELKYCLITKLINSEDPILSPLFENKDWQCSFSHAFDNFNGILSDELPEEFDKYHDNLPAMPTTLQLKIVNVNIIQNENIEISFDVNGGWVWRDLTNEQMQMTEHKDGEGHAHIHIGGNKLGRTYNGKYTITKEVLDNYKNNVFWLPDIVNITISLVNNMHQGYTSQTLDLEEEKIFGIYHYEPINSN